MHFHGAYFSNYDIWLKDPLHYFPSAHFVQPIIGQDILNSDLHSDFQGIHITSGIFQLWAASGLITSTQLKYATCASLIGTILTICGSYFHQHISWSTPTQYKKFKSLSIHHLSVLFGLSSISWAGHQIHISLPANQILDSGIDPVHIIPCPQDLFAASLHLMEIILPGSISQFFTILLHILFISSHVKFINRQHILIGVGALLILMPKLGPHLISRFNGQMANISWHNQLSINLAITGSLSIAFAHHIYAIPTYPSLSSDYPTLLCLFYHHIWIGGFLIIGAGAHASIFMIRTQMLNFPLTLLLNHRDVIIGHLIHITIALGFHSFSLYIHNDTLQAMGRPEDIFHDNSIQLKPLLTTFISSFLFSFDIKILDKKLIRITQELGTADFLVHHIHAFTIHVALLILSKGILYARSTRLVSDKLELGFRYPCDGPGRGGTCQISPWDHIYLATFWMYNSLSVVLFHYFWKMQSDVWGIYNIPNQKIMHISGGDFSLNSTTINGWLRNFLWSQAAQVIQSYGTSISGYGFIFILAHFIWAFSLMFLYSGRGYWQELIEQILWAHHKLKIIPHIAPRALSISQGRAVGFIHFMIGGVGCTWAFFISRMVVLT